MPCLHTCELKGNISLEMEWCSIIAVLFQLIYLVKGQNILSYATDTDLLVTYQVYGVLSATRSEADQICSRCSTGSVVQVKNDVIWSFLLSNLFTPAGISSGSFWLGFMTTGTPFSRWSDGNSTNWTSWASNHPEADTFDATCDFSASGPGLWYSHPEGHRQTTEVLVVCQYDANVTGAEEWTDWSNCDYNRSLQVRSFTCMSPADSTSTACKCEDRPLELQTCTAGFGMDFNLSASNTFMNYKMAGMDWWAAFHTCRKCSTGNIAMMKTSTDKSIVNDLLQQAGLDGNYFIGLWDLDRDSVWEWVDGEMASWTSWVLLNPTSSVQKTIVMSTKIFFHLWYNDDPARTTNGVLCQYDASLAGISGEWSNWSPCDDAEIRVRHRVCLSPRDPNGSGAGCNCDETPDTETQPCTAPSLAAYYVQGTTGYHLFEAPGIRGRSAELFCSGYCGNLTGTLVTYQSQTEYEDVYNNLIQPVGLVSSDHWIGLTDSGTEGTWFWRDGTAVPPDWSWWTAGYPAVSLIRDSAILTATPTPAVRDAYFDSTFHEDSASIIICEYNTVAMNGIWSDWGAWSACDGSGLQSRTRACLVPTPTLSGCDCVGSVDEFASCTVATTSTTQASPLTTTATQQAPTTTTMTTTSATSTTVTTTSPITSVTETTTENSYTTSTPASTTSKETCLCSVCPFKNQSSNMTLEEKVAALVKDLTIHRSNTSAARRRLTSAGDRRVSAKGLGLTIGLIVILIYLATLILFDASKFAAHGKYIIYHSFGKNNPAASVPG